MNSGIVYSCYYSYYSNEYFISFRLRVKFILEFINIIRVILIIEREDFWKRMRACCVTLIKLCEKLFHQFYSMEGEEDFPQEFSIFNEV